MATDSRPTYLPKEEAKVWEDVHAEAISLGMDPTANALVVQDESRRDALQALARVGGATIMDAPQGGIIVQLHHRQQEVGDDLEESSIRAAARPHSFA